MPESAAPIRGAAVPPRLWPSTKMRVASMPASFRSSATASSASSIVSPFSVNGFSFETFARYTLVRLS